MPVLKKGERHESVSRRMEENKATALMLFERTPNMSAVARAMGVTYETIRNWCKDPIFNEKVQELRSIAVQQVEDSMFENAINHYDEDGNLKSKADFMSGIAILKAYRPERFSDRKTLEVKGAKELIKVVYAGIEDAKVIEDGPEG